MDVGAAGPRLNHTCHVESQTLLRKPRMCGEKGLRELPKPSLLAPGDGFVGPAELSSRARFHLTEDEESTLHQDEVELPE